MTRTLHSITIGTFTYIVGKLIPKIIGYGKTEDATVETLGIDANLGLAVVGFADGDAIAIGLSGATLHYKPSTIEPKGNDDGSSDESHDGQGSRMEMGGRSCGWDADRSQGDSQERQTDEGRAPEDEGEGQGDE